MKFTVENVCGLLIGSKLLAADDVKEMYRRWQTEAGDAVGDLAPFTRWLVAKEYVTDYQAALLAKGYTEGYFIHHYKILERLGKGRMAAVYKAVHHLGQMVAIKVLPPSRGKDPHFLGRFLRESKLAVKLKHPNVVRSFQVGEYTGLHYLVMEFLEGETLDAVLQRRKKLPPKEAVRLIYQALQGLQHIHEQGLVHRDLKPANLMIISGSVTPYPPAEKGRVDGRDTTVHATLKILDIGLGRTLADSADPEAGLTTEGMLLGTPDYLAPEQARDPRSTDIRADIYSLGCVLYHTLTGQPPFPDTNVLSQMVRHAMEPAKPLKEFVPGVPDELQNVVSVMLAKDPDKRYATPEKAVNALQAFMSGAAPAKQTEEGPQLKKFLTWVEMDRDGGATSPAEPAPPPPAKPARPAASVEPSTRPPAAAAPEYDVELVPMAPQGRGPFPVTNRDWWFLAAGAGGVILAGFIGFLMAWMMRS